MRHGVKTKKLGMRAEHRHAMLNNLATSILRQGLSAEQMERKVITTVPKAKVVRGLVDRLITYAKKGDISARRQAAKFVHDSEVLQGLFSDLGPRYAKRAGGYTRVLKTDNRKGDNSEMALITLVEDDVTPRRAARKPKAAAATIAKKASAKKKVDITKAEVSQRHEADKPNQAEAPEAPAAG